MAPILDTTGSNPVKSVCLQCHCMKMMGLTTKTKETMMGDMEKACLLIGCFVGTLLGNLVWDLYINPKRKK